MLLIIDNYDSFTYNLVQYFGELDCDVKVFRNDKIAIEEIKQLDPSHIVISPGPGTPDDAGISKDVIDEFKGQKPILGVCLGHQSIGEVFGGKIVKAPYLMHGKVSEVQYLKDEPLFKGLDNPFTATRYHSLVVDNESIANKPLEVIAWTTDNIIMALRHKEFKNLLGVQFHPESILTQFGHKMLENFLSI